MATLIPFALSLEKDMLVDVSEVEKGLACNCVCPSCSQKLLAIKGNDRAWHFRHAARHTYQNTTNRCDYSFYHSVRMMARQILAANISLELPAFNDTVLAEPSSDIGYMAEKFTVTPPRTIHLEDIQIEEHFQTVSVDVKATVKGIDFCCYLTHPNRPVPYELADKTNTTFGAIAIDLTRIFELFDANSMKKDKTSLKKLLSDHIEFNLESKSWLNHPRYNKAHDHATKKLQYRIKQLQYENDKHVNSVKTGLEGFIPKSCKGKVRHCSACNIDWPLMEGYICPRCLKPGQLI